VRPGKLFTANERLFVSTAATVRIEKLFEVTGRSSCFDKVDRDVTLEPHGGRGSPGRLPARRSLFFAPSGEAVRQRVRIADPNIPQRWSEWVLTATGLEDVFAQSVQRETPILGVPDSVVRPLFLPYLA